MRQRLSFYHKPKGVEARAKGREEDRRKAQSQKDLTGCWGDKSAKKPQKHSLTGRSASHGFMDEADVYLLRHVCLCFYSKVVLGVSRLQTTDVKQSATGGEGRHRFGRNYKLRKETETVQTPQQAALVLLFQQDEVLWILCPRSTERVL